MTDDYSPMELSLAWDSANSRPKVRFSIEAIGPAAGTADDPFNQSETMKVIANLRATQPHLEWELFEHFHSAFSGDDNVDGDFPHRSSLGLGFDFSGGRINVGAYLTPPVKIPDPSAGWRFTYDMISRFKKEEVDFHSAHQLHDFLTRTETGRELCFVGLGIDCVETSKSRLKIYLRSRNTSRESIERVLTMDGAIAQPWTKPMLQKLYTLLDMIAPAWKGAQPLASLTSGMLYNFDIHGRLAEPYPRIYIPVKHYGTDDLTVAEKLEEFLAMEGRTWGKGEYVSMLRQVCTHRRLEDDKGLQTFVAISPKGGNMAVAAYISPHVYTRLAYQAA